MFLLLITSPCVLILRCRWKLLLFLFLFLRCAPLQLQLPELAGGAGEAAGRPGCTLDPARPRGAADLPPISSKRLN